MKQFVVCVAALVFAGCDPGSPLSPVAAKSSQGPAESFPVPRLGIDGTWVNLRRASSDDPQYILVDSLHIVLAPEPHPVGEPGMTYYIAMLRTYVMPPMSHMDLGNMRHTRWDEDTAAFMALGLDPPLIEEEHRIMGVYDAGAGKWAFNYSRIYSRDWWSSAGYDDEWDQSSTILGRRYWWDLPITLFNGELLVIGWPNGQAQYRRVILN